jgi:predicted RNase H-like HicB family nuclease
MKVDVIIERGENGFFSAYMNYDGFDFGLCGDGYSIEETIKDFLEGKDFMKESYKEEGRPFPEELEFNFKYDVPSFLAYYSDKLSLAGLQRITGVNQEKLSHYITGKSKPRPKTTERIEKKLHAFAEEIRQLHLLFELTVKH